jgi:hypothetical protein
MKIIYSFISLLVMSIEYIFILVSTPTLAASGVIPDAPVLLTPTNGANCSVNRQDLILTWTTVAGAVSYRLQISGSFYFEPNRTPIDDSTLTIGVDRNPDGIGAGYFYWRVNAKNASGTSNWSSTHYFTYNSIDAINYNNMHQTTPALDFGTLELYNLNGKCIGVFNGYVSSMLRSQLVNSNIKNVSSGCYTYKLRNKNNSVNMGRIFKK